MSSLRRWLTRFPRKVVHDSCNPSTGPLFTRYILLRVDKWFAVYVHQIHRSDNARDYHDHPWSFASLIIKGEYIEHVPSDRATRYRAWRQILFRPANFQHWLEVKQETWTICIRFGRDRLWGFHNPVHGFVPFDIYPCFEGDELGPGPRQSGVEYIRPSHESRSHR